MEFMAEVLKQPWWLKSWIFWLILVNTASVVFVRRLEARWVLAAWVSNAVLMNLLYAQLGYVRLLGLSHVIFWTPLLVYLYRRRGEWAGAGAYGAWLKVLVFTDAASLLIDYLDVVRYLLGERA